MKTKSSPSLYRYCIGRLSTLADSSLVPALKVLSTTLPDSTALSLVRTKAGPLPGLTCWNSTTDHSCPSMLSTMPFLRSFVLAMRSEGSLSVVVLDRVCQPSSLPGQMRPEERVDPLPRVGRGLGLRTDVRQPEHRCQPPRADVGVVEERVPGVRVLLHVVLHPEPGEVVLQLRRHLLVAAVAGTVARDDRAGALERLGRAGQHPVVVRRHPEPVLRRRAHQGEPAAHAEADDPDFLAGVVPVQQPLTGGGDVLVGAPVTALQRLEGGLEALAGPALAEQVRHEDGVAEGGHPVRRALVHVVGPEDLVDDDDAGELLVARRTHRIPLQVRRATGRRAERGEVDHGPDRCVRHEATQPQGPGGHTPTVSAEVYPDEVSPDIVAIWWMPASLPKTLSRCSVTCERLPTLAE